VDRGEEIDGCRRRWLAEITPQWQHASPRPGVEGVGQRSASQALCARHCCCRVCPCSGATTQRLANQSFDQTLKAE
jgi:hypothetical protein